MEKQDSVLETRDSVLECSLSSTFNSFKPNAALQIFAPLALGVSGTDLPHLRGLSSEWGCGADKPGIPSEAGTLQVKRE